MSENLISSQAAANNAVTAIEAVSVTEGTKVSLSQSNISSMKTGTTVNNQLLPDISKLVDCVKQQSNKFPQIAQYFDQKDQQVAASQRDVKNGK